MRYVPRAVRDLQVGDVLLTETYPADKHGVVVNVSSDYVHSYFHSYLRVEWLEIGGNGRLCSTVLPRDHIAQIRESKSSTATEGTRQMFIVIKRDTKGLHPAALPKEHDSQSAAITEAERLAFAEPGESFAVFKKVAVSSRPVSPAAVTLKVDLV